jgi:hypothetical protein
MNRVAQLLKVNTITYDNMDMNVLIQATSLNDHLSFETQLYVSFSELNLILSELQKRNPDKNVSELFVEERLDQHFTQHFLNANVLNNPNILFDTSIFTSTKKQIRA